MMSPQRPSASTRWASVELAVAGALALIACGSATESALEHAEPGFVHVPLGRFTMGAGAQYSEEGPALRVGVSAFLLKAHEVTNAEFEAFVASTSYVTHAEQAGGSALFVPTQTPERAMSWWRLEPGATWRTPEGPGSDLHGRQNHPVVHVTRDDARAYASWAGGRLPQEVEWEYAASRGLATPDRAAVGPFGAQGTFLANIWTGTFPIHDTAADGYAGTAPVASFPADRGGVYDLIGNVWEWTDTPFPGDPDRVTIKGGSYLCAPDHCARYRPSARQAMEPDFSSSHLGFRIVKAPTRPPQEASLPTPSARHSTPESTTP